MLAKVRPFIPAPIRRRIFKHINTLPVELLAEIFLWCHPIGIFPRPSRDRAPILLERVCRVWRLVSLNTPQLWTHILIEDMKWSWDPPTTWNSRLFDEWLRRSGNCPLSFTIKDHNIEYHAPFTLKLQAEAHRWKSVSLKTDCNCTDDILQTLRIPGNAPMLTELRFLRRSFENRMLIPIASQLRSLYVHVNSEQFAFDCGFRAVRELRIGRCRAHQQFSLLFTQFPSLEILEIEPYPKKSYPRSETATLIHSMQHLHTLIFAGSGIVAELWLLDLFEAPALNSLAISIGTLYTYDEHCREQDRRSLSNFLMRCGGQLKRLMLNGNFVSCHQLFGLTQQTPQLESLCVIDTMLDGDLTTICQTLSLSHIDILLKSVYPYIFDETSRMEVVRSLRSRCQWRASRVNGLIRLQVPLAVLSNQGLKKSVLKGLSGLRISQLPCIEEPWWPRLDME